MNIKLVSLYDDNTIPDPLFIGTFPAGISYADRSREEHGDYKSLAFLSFFTLELTVKPDCPPELAARIREDAARLQAKRGQCYTVSTMGQCVILGEKGMSRDQMDAAWLAYVKQNPQQPLPSPLNKDNRHPKT